MLFYRPNIFVFENRFFTVLQQTFRNNLQPRTAFRRLAVCCAVAISALIIAVTPRQAAATGTLSATPTSASFGNVPIGTANTQSFQLKNIGTSSLTISSATMSGTGFSMSGLSAGTI